VTVAVNWWFDMYFGRDWIYKQLCSNLKSVSSFEQGVSSHDPHDAHCKVAAKAAMPPT